MSSCEPGIAAVLSFISSQSENVVFILDIWLIPYSRFFNLFEFMETLWSKNNMAPPQYVFKYVL